MKKFFAILLCLGVCSMAAADVKIVQKVKSGPMMGRPAKDSTVTISVKGKKARVDTAESKAYQVIDLTAGKVFIVEPTKKEVAVMTTEMMKKAAGMMEQLGGKQEKPTMEKLGTTHTYNGYKCEDVRVTMSGAMTVNSVSCVSKDIDVTELQPFKVFGQDFTKYLGMDGAADVPGYSVHSESKISIMGQSMDNTTDLVSISHDALTDAIFVIPADYKVQEMKVPKQ